MGGLLRGSRGGGFCAMVDETGGEVYINASGRVFYASAGLAFCAGLICYLVACGNPANGLHATAMTGALVILAALLGVLVSPALVTFVAALKGQFGGKAGA